MKKRNVILGILLILIILFGIVFINYKMHKTYYFKLPIANKVVSVSLEKGSQNKLLGDTKEIRKVYKAFKEKYQTKTKNSNDKKINDEIKIIFYYEDAIGTILYLYKIDDNYYLEQVNNGIYEIEEDLYNKVADFIK